LEAAHETIVIYTVAEAAAILRVKKSWLERQAAARKIPFTMLGGAYRFTAEHLAAIVRINEKSPAGKT
jgi:excisionase family DNA binding protein